MFDILDLGGATAVTSSAVEMARLPGNAESAAWALQIDCRVATGRGDIDTAVRSGDAELCRTELLEWGGGPDLPLPPLFQRSRSYER